MEEKYLSPKEELECSRTIASLIKRNKELEYFLWYLKFKVFKTDKRKSRQHGSFSQVCTKLYQDKNISLAPSTCYEIAWAYEEKRLITEVIQIDISHVNLSVHARLQLRKETSIEIKTKIIQTALSDCIGKKSITQKDIINAKNKIFQYLHEKEKLLSISNNQTTKIGIAKTYAVGVDSGVSPCTNEVINNQGVPFYPNKPIYTWQGMRFRSKAEVQIAKALDRVGVLFMPNCLARLTDPRKTDSRRNMEADFFVFYEGKWGILEVDGPSHKPESRVNEQERDRLFQHNGIAIIQRFINSRCERHPDDVVREFLQIIKKIG